MRDNSAYGATQGLTGRGLAWIGYVTLALACWGVALWWLGGFLLRLVH